MRAAAVGLVLCLAVPAALADKSLEFEDVLQGAVPVSDAAAVRALAWPFSGSCSGAEPGFDTTQCRALKRRAKQQAAGHTYHIETAAPTTLKGKVLTVYGCIDCDSDKRVTIGAGKIVRSKGAVLGPVLGRVNRATKPEVAARLMTEIVFRLDGAGRPKLAAYRAYDPCTGEVLLANPPSEERNPSKKCVDGKPVSSKDEKTQ